MAMKTPHAEKKTSIRKARSPRQARSAQQSGGLASEVRQKLGLSRKMFSRLTGYSERAIANWESGRAPDEPGLRRIREIERFQTRLAEVVRLEEIPAWLDTPNDAFGGLKPLEVIERGEIDRLWNMIFYLESGVAS
jgi:DNA-binding transcriptional regulator YiaG